MDRPARRLLHHVLPHRGLAPLLALALAVLSIGQARADEAPDLHTAARRGDFETMSALLEAGTNVDDLNDRETTALLSVCSGLSGEDEELALSVVRYLLAEGADVTFSQPHTLTTPLHAAVRGKRSPDLPLELIRAGADVNALDRQGFNPLHRALNASAFTEADWHTFLVAMFGAGLDFEARSEHGETALLVAAQFRPSMVRVLVDAGADVGSRNDRGKTALHLASAHSIAERRPDRYDSPRPAVVAAMQALIAAGSDLNALDSNGNVPLVVASADATRILLQAGAQATGVPGRRPPLHEAAKEGDGSRVEQLLAAGADPTIVWQGHRAVDETYIGMRKYVGNSYEYHLERGAGVYVEVMDLLVAAGGAEWKDRVARFAGIHPLDARSRLFLGTGLAFIYLPLIVVGFLVLLTLIVLWRLRNRATKAAAIAAVLTLLAMIPIYLYALNSSSGAGWAAGKLVPVLVGFGAALAATVFVMIFLVTYLTLRWRDSRAGRG